MTDEPKFDYSHLKVEERTARVILYQVKGEPYLDVLHAGETNKRYFNSLLKRSRNNMKRMRAGAMDAATMAMNREEDRFLYPKHIVRAWGCKDGPGFILDSFGNRIDYSEGNVGTFLRALPDWIFDEVRVHANEETNFVDELDEEEEIPDPETVAGN